MALEKALETAIVAIPMVQALKITERAIMGKPKRRKKKRR